MPKIAKRINLRVEKDFKVKKKKVTAQYMTKNVTYRGFLLAEVTLSVC